MPERRRPAAIEAAAKPAAPAPGEGSANTLIARLGLRPHPEGGHYAETFRDAPADGGRGACTAIHYLLKAGERSHWHKVDAVEIWCWHSGAPLLLRIHDRRTTELRLDADHPQAVVPAHAWQAAEPLGDWALVSCIVAPAFDFAGFTMAPPGWEPDTETP